VIGCTTAMQNRSLQLVNNAQEIVGEACLIQIDSYRVDYYLPASLPPGLYRINLVEATTQRLLKYGADTQVVPDASITVVDATRYTAPVTIGGFGSAFGTALASTTLVGSTDPAQCTTTLGGVRAALYSLSAAQQYPFNPWRDVCVSYVSPAQVNFRVPEDVPAGQAWIYLCDGDAPGGDTKLCPRSTRFQVEAAAAPPAGFGETMLNGGRAIWRWLSR
jgi:hypothetical protein